MALGLLALLPIAAPAETYLCVAEAGAAVAHGGKAGIHAGLADVSDDKYILTQEDGNWVLKELGKDAALFDRCSDGGRFCERADNRYGGTWWKLEDGVFGLTYSQAHTGEVYMFVVKGRCSKI